jgi:hypothetical protein
MQVQFICLLIAATNCVALDFLTLAIQKKVVAVAIK